MILDLSSSNSSCQFVLFCKCFVIKPMFVQRASVSPSCARERCYFNERQTENHTNYSSDQGYRPFNISIKEKELLLLTVTLELHILRDIKRHKTDRAFPGDVLDEGSSS